MSYTTIKIIIDVNAAYPALESSDLPQGQIQADSFAEGFKKTVEAIMSPQSTDEGALLRDIPRMRSIKMTGYSDPEISGSDITERTNDRNSKVLPLLSSASNPGLKTTLFCQSLAGPLLISQYLGMNQIQASEKDIMFDANTPTEQLLNIELNEEKSAIKNLSYQIDYQPVTMVNSQAIEDKYFTAKVRISAERQINNSWKYSLSVDLTVHEKLVAASAVYVPSDEEQKELPKGVSYSVTRPDNESTRTFIPQFLRNIYNWFASKFGAKKPNSNGNSSFSQDTTSVIDLKSLETISSNSSAVHGGSDLSKPKEHPSLFDNLITFFKKDSNQTNQP